MAEKSTIERALELSADRRHRTVVEIRATLAREGYPDVHAHLAGKGTIKALKDRIGAAWSERRPAPPI